MVLLLGKMSHACEKSMCSTFIGGEFFESVKVVSGNVHVSLSTGPRHTPVQRTGVHSGTIPSSPSSVLTATVLFRAC